MISPDVSVVMSVYNGERYLNASLESVLSQEQAPFELIVVNDGSTDNSAAILARAASRDARVRVIEQENQGLTCALITGCQQAQSPFIARHDVDDLSLPGRFARLAALLKEDEQVDMASSAVRYIGPGGEHLDEIHRSTDRALATRRLLHDRQGPPAHGSVMFRRSAYERVGGYRRQFYYAQDSDLWLRMGQHGQIAYAPDVLYLYRRELASISSHHRDVQREFGRLGQACLKARLAGQSEDDFLAEAARLREVAIGARQQSCDPASREAAMNYLIGASLARRRDRRAMGYLWNTVRARPGHWRAWARLAGAWLMAREVPANETDDRASRTEVAG